MTTIHDLLAEYAQMARDTREKGLLLERLARAYLTTDPVWTARFEDVWLWQDWPGRKGKVDTGVDLVAKERYGDGFCAIQCKFYAPTHSIDKGDIDSFFTASGKHPFTSRMVISTTEKWSKHAADALIDQHVKTWRVGVDDLAQSEIDWSQYSLAKPDELVAPTLKQLRPHQEEAVADVAKGFKAAPRGKLVMACGTGKTFTSLRIAESIAGAGGSVLFLVPSIALLSQTLKEWAAERTLPLRAFAICSDNKVGKYAEDYSVSDLAYPATTSTAQLLTEVAKAETVDGMTVYFSTYQSVDVVAKAQAAGLPEFDLVICDEAHRTAGFTLEKGVESSFLRVHDESAIKAKKRLYMTATPKIYGEAVRTKASEKNAVLVSMDDEATFGPTFHRLGFGDAVERDLLTDYRVLVLTVDEGTIGAGFQESFAVDGDLNIPDAARIVGIYNGLAKRGVQGLGSHAADRAPLRRAVAFSRSIKDSQKVQSMLNGYDGSYTRPAGVSFPSEAEQNSEDAAGQDAAAESPLRLEAKHVDGTMNVMIRNQMLDWLKAETNPDDNVCRILTNARCLSEGVDVPALDAVIFLNSRDSQVDVVQSVGRVMRKVEGKDYGYIILPIAVSADMTPEQALNDNTKYKVVWDVLRALRAHDERFEAKIEQLDLNGRSDDQLQVIDVRDPWNSDNEQQPGDNVPDNVSVAMDWSTIGADWRTAIYAKIVDKVGERDYWENWARDVAEIAKRQRIRIASLVQGSNEHIRTEFAAFVGGLQDNLNPSITGADAIEMLSQHLITEPVFDALFKDYSFSANNPVSQVMQRMVDALQGSNLQTETEELESFYASVRRSVNGITDAAGKQTTIKRLYEKFFSGAFKDTHERLGIVYTPNEIVDFILKSADEVLRKEFGATLSDEGVHILDPFTGTGTFIVRLLQSGLIKPADLVRKYRHELHASEIVLLAYYVAAVNIEETFHGLVKDTGGAHAESYGVVGYEPFPGIVLTDTFQSAEDDDRYDDGGIFGDNNERAKAQNALDIRVIVGNPPYSSGQDSANDNNQNLKYPFLDARIASTYAAKSTAQNKNSLYDSYIRAIRWASDRIKDRGVVAFVSNGGFLDGNTADGLRKSLAEEFSSLYIFNLRGNTRTSGEQARKEGGQTFGSGSRATIAISVLVRNPNATEHGLLHYRDIGDYLTREQKLSLVGEYGSIDGVPWEPITPNDAGDWLNQRDDTFGEFTPIGTRSASHSAVFTSYSRGLATARDAWVYNSSRFEVKRNVRRMLDSYKEQVDALASGAITELSKDSKVIAWGGELRKQAERGTSLHLSQDNFVNSTYRPFNKQHVYFDARLNERRYQLPKMFPTAEPDNLGFYYVGMGSAVPFSVLMLDSLPDLHVTGAGSGGQFFPRYTYELRGGDTELDIFGESDPYTSVDNVTDEIIAEYRGLYGADVTKDDVFFFVYGLLHSPDYRTTYAGDLKKMLPRIPKLADATDFVAFAESGRRLSALHLGYESVVPYPLEMVTSTTGQNALPDLRVTKMRFGGKAGAWDKTTIRYNDEITLTGIPDEAHEYMLGSRSAVEWIIERYRVKQDKDSGIVNDPNDWATEHNDPEYVLNLFKRIVTVSVQTVAIVNSLPSLRILDELEVASEVVSVV
ncbi:type ISP restriction/modification enzyme [Cryobacterium sp. Sr3]|uniref:DEAD/DEAH box helicase n=1 Tax=Cryobacterium sp. Sr3 TaxID=1259194 RepID=UPI00106CDD6A|nr:type ISP restriction/modification enzyme [Cryobacterium sp. Sr3]TFB53435.1 damage-inducible protein [Cryobacterium sp. Sr3]